MFDQLRDSIRALSDRLSPDERRRVTTSMRDAMVHAKLGIQDLRDGVTKTQERLTHERVELDTVQRRLGLAAQIGDQETVSIAERFATQHAERVSVLESKLMVQQQEVSLAERELEEMSSQLRMAMSGIAPGASHDTAAHREVDAILSDDPLAADAMRATADAPTRRSRAEREADADERLAALKRRMGK